jgi:hypothetical protein
MSMGMTTRGFMAMQEQAEKRRQKEQLRRDEMYAKRPGWSADVALEDERQQKLADVESEIAEHEAFSQRVMEELTARRRNASKEVTASANGRRLLIETAPKFLTNKLNFYRSRLESAETAILEPEPTPPQAIAGLRSGQSSPAFPTSMHGGLVSAEELRADYQMRLEAHRERVNRCRATAQKFTPIVHALLELAMQPDPTESEVAAILEEHGEASTATAC